jgi:hypothetical protein
MQKFSKSKVFLKLIDMKTAPKYGAVFMYLTQVDSEVFCVNKCS